MKAGGQNKVDIAQDKSGLLEIVFLVQKSMLWL